MRIGIGLLLLMCGLAAGPAQAELYRYVDRNGGVVLSRHGVPPELIGNGYEVLNDQGRVVRVVPPAPTPAERARLQALERSALHDANLLRLYSSVDDVERARLRKLGELDGLIAIAEGNLQVLVAQRLRLEKEQADLERVGAAVDASVMAHVERLGTDQIALQQQLERYRDARLQAEAGFTRDSARIAELLDGAR